MENRFAGAQDLGDRRRRRMSTADHDEELYAEFFPDQPVTGPPVSPLLSVDDDSAKLLQRFIPAQLWKHLTALAVSLLVVGAAIWWQHTRESATDAATLPALPLVIPGLTGLLLIFAGQLSLLTGWVRSQSTLDFRGQYRWWKWLGGGAVLIGCVIVTGVSHHIPELLTRAIEPFTGPIRAARPALILVPTLVLSTLVLGKVLRDMSRSIWSQGLLVIAVLTMCVRLMLIHTASEYVQVATLDQMLLGSAWLTFAAALLHCRYVSFVCNDAPAEAIRTARKATAVATSKEATDMEPVPNTGKLNVVSDIAADEPSMPIEALDEVDNLVPKSAVKAKSSSAKKKTRSRKSRKKAA